MLLNKIAIKKILKDDVKSAVFEALKLINAQSLFTKSNMNILIKPNLLIPKNPERAVTTHPAVIKAVIQWIKQFHPKKIIVAESSGTNTRGLTEKAFNECGVRAVCEEEGIDWIPFEKTKLKFYKVKRPLVLKKFPASILLEEVDLIVNIPKIKTHRQCLLTCSIKNMFGTVILGNKSRIHFMFPNNVLFNAALVDVYSVSQPQLTIIDGYYCQEGNGPTAGDVVKLDLVIAGYDPVALDTVVCNIIGFDTKKVLYIVKAEQKGLGSSDITKQKFFGEPLLSVKRNFKKPKNQIYIFQLFKFLFEQVIKKVFIQVIEFDLSKCKLCSICWKNCPAQALYPPEKLKKGYAPKWDKELCIKCYCCAEFCPHEAINFQINKRKIFLKFFISALILGSILQIFLLLMLILNI